LSLALFFAKASFSFVLKSDVEASIQNDHEEWLLGKDLFQLYVMWGRFTICQQKPEFLVGNLKGTVHSTDGNTLMYCPFPLQLK